MYLDSCSDWFLEQEFEKAKRAAEKKKDLIEELLEDLEIAEPKARTFDIDSYFQDRVQTTKRTVGQVRKEIENPGQS